MSYEIKSHTFTHRAIYIPSMFVNTLYNNTNNDLILKLHFIIILF